MVANDGRHLFYRGEEAGGKYDAFKTRLEKKPVKISLGGDTFAKN